MQRSESEYFNNQNMAVVGDSLAVGYDGAHVVEKNYPTSLKEILHPESIDNYGVSGSQISGNQNGPIEQNIPVDLTNNLQSIIKKGELKSVDSLILEIGVNDLNYSDNNLSYVQQRLQNNIRAIRAANRDIAIYGVLPIPSYVGGNNLFIKGQAGYTFYAIERCLK